MFNIFYFTPCFMPSTLKILFSLKTIVFCHTFTQSVIVTEKAGNYFIQVTLYLKTIKGN